MIPTNDLLTDVADGTGYPIGFIELIRNISTNSDMFEFGIYCTQI